MRALTKNSASRPRASVLVLALVMTMVLGIIILFSLRAAQQDTHAVHREIQQLQARYLAEGAINRAKSDVLCQIAATSFLGGAFETVEEKYARFDARFNLPDQRIPGDMDVANADWEKPEITSRAFWNYVDDESLDVPGMNDWEAHNGTMAADAITESPTKKAGNVRVYVTRAKRNDTGSTVTGSVGAFGITLSAAATVQSGGQNAVYVISKSYEHQLGYPQLFNYLMLGFQISDCSMCHLKMYGDVGQVRADDPLEVEIPWDSNRYNRSTIWGSIHMNGPYRRDSINLDGSTSNTKKFQEKVLKSPGVTGATDAQGKVYDAMYVYAGNGSTLADQWKAENPTVTDPTKNPFRSIKSLSTPLPSSWPSVKDNLLDWFEPRAAGAAESGESLLKVEPRDNNITATFQPVLLTGANAGSPDTTKTALSFGTGDVYSKAIDRAPFGAGTDATTALASKSDANKNVAYNKGFHPADDLDGDTIPNGFDADIDNDGMIESPRASADPTNEAYGLTSADLASYYTVDTNVGSPTEGQRVWTLGRTYDATAKKWKRATTTGATYQILNQNQITASRLSKLYKDNSSGSTKNYGWDAAVTGIATSMTDLINNNFASTSGDSAGTVKGVFPSVAKDSNGNPDYSANDGKRSLFIVGSPKNPIQTTGQVVIRGDALLTGYVQGTGSVITHRNIYVPSDLRYVTEPDWSAGADAEGDQIGLVAGGNVLVGNILQNINNSTADLMGFVWGNMININDPTIGSGYWGRDGTAQKYANHMINPTYLMDGAEGGRWVAGRWVYENAGNTVANVFNSQAMQVGGGLNLSSPYLNADRKHMNFTGNSNPNTNNDSGSFYKNYYVSTPGLLPLGANLMTGMPANQTGSSSNPLPGTTFFGNIAGSAWFNTNDFKFFTQEPKASGGTDNNGAQKSSSNWSSGVGAEPNNKWIKYLDGVIYSDNGVIGGNMGSYSSANFLSFRGTVIGRDIQILSSRASQKDPETTNLSTSDNTYLANGGPMFTNQVGSLYYDWRLRGTVNPLGFPYEEGFVGGEMAMAGLPPRSNSDGAPDAGGNRDNWVPFRLTKAYKDQIENDGTNH